MTGIRKTIMMKSIEKAMSRVNELNYANNSGIDYSVAYDVADISRMYYRRYECSVWTGNHLQEMLDRTHARLDELENKYLKGGNNETEGS